MIQPKMCTEWVCKDFKSYVLGLDDGNLAFADLGGELRGRRAATGAAPDHHQLEAENIESVKDKFGETRFTCKLVTVKLCSR